MSLRAIYDAVMAFDEERVAELARAEIEAGTDVNAILNEGMIAALDEVGRKFSEGILFVPEMLMDDCFIGVGIWRPDSTALGKIRDAIIGRDKVWLSAINDKAFKKNFKLSGESLKTAPRGYDKQHPLIKDLRRKDFIAISHVDDKKVLSKNFKEHVIKQFSNAELYMEFLCKALSLKY